MDEPQHAGYLQRKALEFWDCFESTEQLTDLDQAITYIRQALNVPSITESDRTTCVSDLGLAFEDHYIETNNIADLEQSIEYYQQALELTQVDDQKRSKTLYSLGFNIVKRFHKTGQTSDLEQAKQCYLQTLESAAEDDLKLRSKSVDSLAGVYWRQFQKSNQFHDLKQSILYGEEALPGLPVGSTKLGKRLGILGNAYGHLFERTNATESQQRSIWYYQRALEAGPAESPDRATLLGNLGLTYGDKYQVTSDVADQDRFREYMQQAYEATPSSNTIDRASRLGSIGAAIWGQFERTGQTIFLERAIQHFQRAFEALPHSHPEYITQLSSLGVALLDRYRRTNLMADVEKCIEYCRQVLECVSVDDALYTRHLDNLGTAYGDRFARTDDMADLNQSIEHHQRAVDAMSAHHSKDPRSASLLATRLGIRYGRTNNMEDLERHVKYAHQAVEYTPTNHIDRAGALCILGYALGQRFDKLEQDIDIENSIEYCQQAVEMTPEDHPQVARYLVMLGQGLALRHSRTPSSEALNRSTKVFQRAVSSSVGFPSIRIGAGKCAADNLLEEENWSAAAEVLSDILQLLPEITLPTNSRYDMQHSLQALSDVASLAASVFLKAGKRPIEALQGLEKARGIIASFLIDARSDISILKERHPELWSRYTHTQQQIASIDSKFQFLVQDHFRPNYATTSSQRQQLYDTLHTLREEIRQCPGFERFLQSPTEAEIRDLARAGPVVCFNVSQISSEAFLVMSTGVNVLPLPNLKVEDVRRQIRLFASTGNSARRDATLCEDDEDGLVPAPDLSTELQSIWSNAVEPVLQQAGLLASFESSHELPRIWWVGGGIMALLPVHAAGNHAPGSSDNTLSHAVSSFAPTLRSLQFIQARPSFSIRAQKPEVLIVSMPTTPGAYKPLNVAGEVASISNHLGSVATIRHLERPTKADVLEALKSCAIAHFACHGSVNGIQPAQSALIVGQDTEQLLTVADLDEVRHDNAQIAYLSACSTAEIQALQWVDESIHLASAFQLSGFPHVIGTLWGAEDSAAVKIASQFYKNLLQPREDGKPLVAQALHDAVLSFRNTANNQPAISKWAPFIHLGC